MEGEAKFKLLIVEDTLVNQKILVDTLQDTYKIMTAANGNDAINLARRFYPHLIILDIMLPDINGFEVLKILKANPNTKKISVIIVTGLDNDNDEEIGLNLGAVDYIRKPFNSFLVKYRVNIHIQIIKQLATIEKLSYFDPLTGLANRRKFDFHMEYEWHRAIRKKTSLGFLIIDLDKFKYYNDTYGHLQGDVILKALAQTLNSILTNPTYLPCRWGGEEFTVLMPETSLEDVLLIAEQIRRSIEIMETANIFTNQMTKITVSIGAISEIPQSEEELEMYINKADQLLYLAKHEGRNRVCTFGK